MAEEAPLIWGRWRSRASLFTCLAPEALGGLWGPGVVMGKGRSWNCKGVRSVRVGGWGGPGGWGPQAKGRGVERLPISSVAPFQGPRFPVLL